MSKPPSVHTTSLVPPDKDAVHTLKNLLSIIMGFADLLLADRGSDQQRHADLLVIRETAEEALRLTPQLRVHTGGRQP